MMDICSYMCNVYKKTFAGGKYQKLIAKTFQNAELCARKFVPDSFADCS